MVGHFKNGGCSGVVYTSILIPSLPALSFAGVPSSVVTAFDTSIFLGGILWAQQRGIECKVEEVDVIW